MRRQSNKQITAILFTLAFLIYANALFAGFVLDDQDLIIKKSTFFSHPDNVLAIFTIPDATFNAATPYYRPLNTLSYMLDHYLWGLHPFGYHLENILIHALVAVLLYLLLVEVFNDWRLAFFAAVLFAVYPVNAEAVDAVFNRNTLFCALFSLASLLLLAKGGTKWTALSFLAYFFALLSKEPAAVVPFFLLTFAITSGGRAFRARWKALAGFFAILILYFFIRQHVLGVFVANESVPFSIARLKFMSAVIFENFRLMLFPFKLDANYSLLKIFYTPSKAAAATAGLASLVFFSIYKKTPAPVRAGSQWILWGLLPVSNIVMIPSAPVAERYLYTILPGFVLILAYALSALYRRKARATVAAGMLLTVAMGSRTFDRNFVWRDNMSLYRSVIRSDPGNPEYYYYLALSLYNAGRLDESRKMFESALKRQPDYPEALTYLGLICMKKGDLEGAKRQFQSAVSLQPDYAAAHAQLGVVYAEQNLFEQAEHEFGETVRLDPGSAGAHLDLAITLLRLGLYKKAQAEFINVLSLAPDNITAHNDLGAIYARQGRLESARREFRAVLTLDPGNSLAARDLSAIGMEANGGK